MSESKLLEDLVQVYVEESDVDTLKTLREMDSNWNKLAIKELEKRAEQDQLKQLDFSRKGCWDNFGRFLENTGENPKLFHSFRFSFPESFKFVDSSFFNIYKPMFLHLEFNQNFEFTDRSTKYLVNFFTWIAPTLEELKVRRLDYIYGLKSIWNHSFILPAHSGHLVFPKLTTLILNVKKNDNFKFILDKSGSFDPTPKLTTLSLTIGYHADLVNIIGPLNSTALARWSQFVNLTIHFNGSMDYHMMINTLVSMCQAGISLKMLKLGTCYSTTMQSENLQELCSNLSHFLEIQSKSLQVLDLSCVFKTDPPGGIVWPKNRLPIFENVHTLCLDLCYETEVVLYESPYHQNTQDKLGHIPLYKMGPLQVHFPKLDHLEMSKEDFLAIYPNNGELVEPIPLKSLHIRNERGNFDAWSSKFRPLEKLTCDGRLFKFEDPEVPWKESLKELEISNVHFPIKVSHLTNLRKLIVNVGYFFDLHMGYLTYFDQVIAPKLSEIIFKTREKPYDEITARFIQHFPFPVLFQDLPYKIY